MGITSMLVVTTSMHLPLCRRKAITLQELKLSWLWIRDKMRQTRDASWNFSTMISQLQRAEPTSVALLTRGVTLLILSSSLSPKVLRTPLRRSNTHLILAPLKQSPMVPHCSSMLLQRPRRTKTTKTKTRRRQQELEPSPSPPSPPQWSFTSSETRSPDTGQITSHTKLCLTCLY